MLKCYLRYTFFNNCAQISPEEAKNRPFIFFSRRFSARVLILLTASRHAVFIAVAGVMFTVG